jgi:ADP-heptose:LPS heptosyltransferase
MPLRPELWEAIRDRFEGRPLASISVSAGHPDKAYPAANWHEVAQGLLARGFAVAFLGGPTDSPIELPGTHDLVRKLPLESTMAVVANSRIHLCGDTGTGHMAAAYGVPVVSVFGPTDPCQFRPYTTNGIVLHEGPETAQIAPRQVLDAVREVEERSHSQLPH